MSYCKPNQLGRVHHLAGKSQTPSESSKLSLIISKPQPVHLPSYIIPRIPHFEDTWSLTGTVKRKSAKHFQHTVSSKMSFAASRSPPRQWDILHSLPTVEYTAAERNLLRALNAYYQELVERVSRDQPRITALGSLIVPSGGRGGHLPAGALQDVPLEHGSSGQGGGGRPR